MKSGAFAPILRTGGMSRCWELTAGATRNNRAPRAPIASSESGKDRRAARRYFDMAFASFML